MTEKTVDPFARASVASGIDGLIKTALAVREAKILPGPSRLVLVEIDRDGRAFELDSGPTVWPRQYHDLELGEAARAALRRFVKADKVLDVMMIDETKMRASVLLTKNTSCNEVRLRLRVNTATSGLEGSPKIELRPAPTSRHGRLALAHDPWAAVAAAGHVSGLGALRRAWHAELAIERHSPPRAIETSALIALTARPG